MIKLGIFRRLNYPLILGSILLIILIITSIYPDQLATADPYGKQRLEFQSDENGQSVFVIPPVPPGKEYPWGTDHMGRDIKSLIIYGCKITMIVAVLTAIGRLAIALPFAISGAYKNKFSIWFIKQFNILFSAFPLIIIVIILSKLKLFVDFLKDDNLIMALMLTLFGWSKLAYVLMEKVNQILNQDFIEGEIAIGKSKLEIAIQNVIPHLIPSLIVMFFLEIAIVLQTMAQIGIFALMTTGGFYNADGDMNVPFEFDWASLLIFTYMFFGTDKMYLVIYPATAFAVSIIGFNLFGEGLRIEFEKRTSRVITFIRKIPSYVSPFRLAYEIKNINLYRKAVYTKLICYGLVILIVFFPQAPSLYKFEAAEAFNTIEAISGDTYKGRLAGSRENRELANYIKGKMEDYGFKPFEGSYIHEFDIKRSVNIKGSTLKVLDSISGEKEFQFRKDYVVSSPVNLSSEFEVAVVDPKDLYDMNQNKFQSLMERNLSNKLIMIDLRGVFDFRRINMTLQNIAIHIKPVGIIFLENWETDDVVSKYVRMNPLFSKMAVISMSKEAGNELLRIGTKRVDFSVQADVITNSKGYNIFGYIPGTDESLKDEYIVIGSRIDYVGDDTDIRYQGALEAGGVAAQLEIAKKLAKSGIQPKKNIIFAFWDGSYNDDRGSSYFVKKYVLPGDISEVTYIDIGNLALQKENKVLMDTSRIFPINKDAQEYINILKGNARKQGIKLVYGSVYSTLMIDLQSTSVQSMLISSSERVQVSNTSKDTIEVIDKNQYKKIGQMLLDTIVDIARGK
ncbi:MAG: binding-protein-dependent transport system inner rane component [Clostridia bacterium]|jgi:peptide/nickel transport system permease protein|nr:binding-protein-dependent transport system inner rane component [Clostridia bacterium]